ncbi:DUF4017 family protein [Pueribacillus sp. YX66]|uniref:DUF4017 family protein n=1 Tax=Pueribacillus sp. YX66 TaxID=3229242 RepID=UPI00358D06AD
MKTFIPSLLAYIIACVFTILIPASEGYNTVSWKLFVGQLYAIPVFIIVAMLTIIVNKKRAVRG